MKLCPMFVRAAAASAAIAAMSMACAADKDDFELRAEKLRAGPHSAPVQNDTGFTSGLKCMDGLFREFGIRNVTVIIDEIPDATKKVNVGARDMFMSATSEMTRTSHAIRLVPLVESRVFSESKKERVVAEADFVIQGSISQFDDSMLQKQRDGAVCLWYLCVGAAESDAFSGLGLDLNLVETSGMSLVPGANVRNAVLIRKRGKGFDGDLTYKKFSAQYNFTLVSHDGNGQAMRTLVDLGAIEMYGRLLKLPYWSCLGATDQDPQVKSEIDDWWEEMAADAHDRARLFAYLQIQMKAQGLYSGDVNGRVDPSLLRAVRAYRMALGQPDDLNLDSSFLRKYLAADNVEVRKVAAVKLDQISQREGPLAPVAVAPAPAPAPVAAAIAAPAPVAAEAPAPVPAAAAATQPAPVAHRPVASAAEPRPAQGSNTQPVNFRPTAAPIPTALVQAARQANNIAIAYRPGDPSFVGVRTSTSGYLYCYMVDDHQRVSQLFSAAEESLVRASAGEVSVFAVSRAAGQRAVACFSSTRVLGQYPLEVAGIKGGVDALRSKFASVSGNNFEMGVFHVKYQ